MTGEVYISSLVIAKPNFPLRNKDGKADFSAENFHIWQHIFKDVQYYPVSIDMTTSETTEIIVNVHVDESKAGQDFTLSGSFTGRGNLPLESHTFTAKEGENQIAIHSSGHSTTVPWGAQGSIDWSIKSAEEEFKCRTDIEIYAIAPEKFLPDFFDGEMPAELLEVFVLPTTENNIKNYLEYAVAACHRSGKDKYLAETDLKKRNELLADQVENHDLPAPAVHWYQYNVRGGGAAHFIGTIWGGYFDLQMWLEGRMGDGKFITLNCYDQAGLVQIVGSLGVTDEASKIDWYYMAPYGYIPKTDLIGWGQCNNPFFGTGKYSKDPVADTDRSSFSNHAFAIIGGPGDHGKVLDACCGPHIGTENLAQYIEKGVDATVSSSKNATMQTRHLQGSGVKGIKDRARRMDRETMVEVERFELEETEGKNPVKAVKEMSRVEGSKKTETINVDLNGITAKLREESRHTKFGPPQKSVNGSSAVLCWSSLDKNTEIVNVRLEVCKALYDKDGELEMGAHNVALNALCSYVLSSNMPHDVVYEEPPLESKKGSYHLVGRSAIGKQAWVHGNVFVVVSSSAPQEAENDTRLGVVADDIEKCLEEAAKKHFDEKTLESIDIKLSGDNQSPSVGSLFEIVVKAPNAIDETGYKLQKHLIIQTSEDGEDLEDGWKFTYRAIAEGDEVITFSFCSNNGEIDTREFKVSIKKHED